MGINGSRNILPFKIYNNQHYSSFTHSKGYFYYIIQLNDGTKIDINKVGSNNNKLDYRFIIEKLDTQFVNMGISKTSSIGNFVYCTQDLDEIYIKKIRNILMNIK